jgi:hypothetical protein
LPGAVTLPTRDREAWQSIQLALRPGTLADADTACLLALFGVDYSRNTRRVLRSWTLRGGRGIGINEVQACQEEHCVLERVFGHAARLYHRWRDPAVLTWMVAGRLVDSDLRKAENEALLSLWDDHWAEILRAAHGRGVHRVADALGYAHPLVPEPLVWRAYLRHLHAASDGDEARLRTTAIEILTKLKMRGFVP